MQIDQVLRAKSRDRLGAKIGAARKQRVERSQGVPRRAAVPTVCIRPQHRPRVKARLIKGEPRFCGYAPRPNGVISERTPLVVGFPVIVDPVSNRPEDPGAASVSNLARGSAVVTN